MQNVNWHDNNFKTEIFNKFKQNMERACIIVENESKRICPVDTGRLRASITHKIEEKKDEITGIVGTNIEYAIYVEYGTSRMKAEPYLRPSLQKNIPIIKALFGVK